MIYYFSGCGNSKWLAEELSKNLAEELIFIPNALKNRDLELHCEGEILGFVFPIYAWGVPAIVENFIQQLQFRGTPKYVFMACTCGDETGFAHKQMAKILQEKGLSLNAAFSIVMPETYINLPGFKLDTPQKVQEKIEAARKKIPTFVDDIKNYRKVQKMDIGSMPRLKSGLVRFVFNHCIITDRKFKVLETCTSCGLCEKLCPTENIKLSAGRPSWQGNCLNCMACYHHCLQNAIQFGNITAGKGQYYFGK